MSSAIAPLQNTLNSTLSSFNINIPDNIGLVALIITLSFVLVVTLSLARRHFLDYSIKGAGFGVVIGFVLALILEGFLLVGGRTAFTEIIGWENPPKPIAFVINTGTTRLQKVLGANIEVPSSDAAISSPQSFINSFARFSSEDKDIVRENICRP